MHIEEYITSAGKQYRNERQNYEFWSISSLRKFIEDWDAVNQKECEIEKQIFDQYYTQTSGNKEPKDVVLGYKTSLDAQMLDKVGLKTK